MWRKELFWCSPMARGNALIGKLKTAMRVLRQDPQPLRKLMSLTVMNLPFDVGRCVRATVWVQGYKIRFHQSVLAMEHWYNPKARSADHAFITGYLRRGDTYIDVGANIGTTVIPAALTIEDGRVIAFEPHPRTYFYLQDNVALNNLCQEVELHNCALGSDRGHVCFSSCRSDVMNRVLTTSEGMRVPVRLLDDFTADCSRVDLLKLDVEGYEKYVLEGGSRTLAKTQCVYFEISDQHTSAFGYSVRDLLTGLADLNFRLFICRDAERLTPISCEHVVQGTYENAIAIRNLDEFRRRTGWGVSDAR